MAIWGWLVGDILAITCVFNLFKRDDHCRMHSECFIHCLSWCSRFHLANLIQPEQLGSGTVADPCALQQTCRPAQLGPFPLLHDKLHVPWLRLSHLALKTIYLVHVLGLMVASSQVDVLGVQAFEC